MILIPVMHEYQNQRPYDITTYEMKCEAQAAVCAIVYDVRVNLYKRLTPDWRHSIQFHLPPIELTVRSKPIYHSLTRTSYIHKKKYIRHVNAKLRTHILYIHLY